MRKEILQTFDFEGILVPSLSSRSKPFEPLAWLLRKERLLPLLGLILSGGLLINFMFVDPSWYDKFVLWNVKPLSGIFITIFFLSSGLLLLRPAMRWMYDVATFLNFLAMFVYGAYIVIYSDSINFYYYLVVILLFCMMAFGSLLTSEGKLFITEE